MLLYMFSLFYRIKLNVIQEKQQHIKIINYVYSTNYLMPEKEN